MVQGFARSLWEEHSGLQQKGTRKTDQNTNEVFLVGPGISDHPVQTIATSRLRHSSTSLVLHAGQSQRQTKTDNGF